MSMADRLDSSPTKRVKTLEAQAKEAQQTIEELRARDALKTQFLSNVSHDLRTPLAAIITHAEILREGMLGELNQRQRDSVSGIVSGGQQLIDMIDEILTYVRSASDQVNLVRTDFDITELVDQVRTLNQALAAKKHLTIERLNGDDLPQVYADRDKIKHVLGNLIGNAIKFTEKGSVTLRVDLEQPDDSDIYVVHISVADTGIGIPAEKHAAIFDSFAQADASTTRKFGGTGLGLSIVTQLTRLMGGRIWVESQPGLGSTFHVAIPLEIAQPEALTVLQDTRPIKIHASTERAASNGLRVLLAEDNKVNALLASVLLTKAGHHVTQVVSGRQVLDALATHNFDLVLMDVQMPDMDGLEATGEIRRSEVRTGRRIPIVACTAHAMAEDRKSFLDAGADGYLAKPFTPEQLHAVIASMRFLTDEQALPYAS